MGAGFFVKLGIAAAINGGRHPFEPRQVQEKIDEEKREYQRKIEYNKTHLPSKELPPLSPDWDRIEEIVKETRFDIRDVGDSYEYIVSHLHEHYFERCSVLKSELSDDTVKLIDMLLRDVDWFYAHPAGSSVGEGSTVLESFLREKYSMLSEDSISRIIGTYCINDR